MEEQDRAIACFKDLAIGDALAKQTETLRFSDVRTWYPDGIRGFEGVPGDVIPRYRGKRYEWKIGETTDDTEQTLAVTRAALKEKAISHSVVGQELLSFVKSVHPGVSIWAFVQASDPARIAPDGDGCGAAMCVAPIGVIHRSSHIDKIVRDAYECSISTHGGQSAICAAAAVAAAVSASLDGC
ncbi:MAG: ADP-ribosylglycohydrolase family protein, partial [Bryobacteraceae bacterium]|nr:ADP-ribosylglycohydrolase family protein [Bryobacteraceae bacterium]